MRRQLVLNRSLAAGVLAAAIGASGAAAPDTAAGPAGAQPQMVPVAFRGVSPAVSSLSRAAAKDGSAMSRREPGGDDRREQIAFDEHGRRYGTGTAKVSDPLASIPVAAGEGEAPELRLEIDGIPSSIIGPPDTEGAVGPHHFVQAVNAEFQVYDKQGVPVTGRVPLGALWSGLGGTCSNEDLAVDPTVVYDQLADRWLLSYLDWDNNLGLTSCIAVSTSGSPAGEYFLYQLDTVEFADYLKLGVWPDEINDAYLMGTNSGAPGVYDVYALDRRGLLAGVEPRRAGSSCDGGLARTGSSPCKAPSRRTRPTAGWPASPSTAAVTWRWATTWSTPPAGSFRHCALRSGGATAPSSAPSRASSRAAAPRPASSAGATTRRWRSTRPTTARSGSRASTSPPPATPTGEPASSLSSCPTARVRCIHRSGWISRATRSDPHSSQRKPRRTWRGLW